MFALRRIDTDQAHSLARDLERVCVQHPGNAADGFSFASRRADAGTRDSFFDDVANAAATDTMNASERPPPWPWTTGDDLADSLVVDVHDGGQAIRGVGVDVDALGVSWASEGNEGRHDGGEGVSASHRANMPALRPEP